jgi:hypothetical protein
MPNSKTLSQLFDDEPAGWGLRGDPFLWRELKTSLGDQAYPKTEAGFKLLLERTYEQLTGQALTEPGSIFVERYSHGGMSSGRVDPHFWLETGFPLLLTRYRETKRSENAG